MTGNKQAYQLTKRAKKQTDNRTTNQPANHKTPLIIQPVSVFDSVLIIFDTYQVMTVREGYYHYIPAPYWLSTTSYRNYDRITQVTN